MKTLDFTQPGRMPVTQDVLSFMQTAYKEQIAALAALVGCNLTNVPIVLSGLANNGSTLTAGWFVYNGEIIYCAGGDISSPPLGTSYAINIASTASPLALLYGDGSNPSVKSDKTGVLTALSSITTGPALFPITAFTTFAAQMGLIGRESTFSAITLSKNDTYGIVTGTLNYKKNNLARTIQIAGTATVQVASSTATNTFFNVGTMPAGYRPSGDVFFLLYYQYDNPGIKEQYGNDYYRWMTGKILNNGVVQLGVIFPFSGSATLTFNTIIPID